MIYYYAKKIAVSLLLCEVKAGDETFDLHRCKDTKNIITSKQREGEKMAKDAEKIIGLFKSGFSIEDICKEIDSSIWYCE